MKKSIAVILSVFVLVAGLAPASHANLGYLTARKTLGAQAAKLVAVENADRKAVYRAIAAKAKSSATTVGKTRAASIRKSAPKGTWVQLPNGGSGCRLAGTTRSSDPTVMPGSAASPGEN